MTLREALTNRFTAYAIVPAVCVLATYIGFDSLREKTYSASVENYQRSLKDITELKSIVASQAAVGLAQTYQSLANNNSTAASFYKRCVRDSALVQQPQVIATAQQPIMLAYAPDQPKIGKCIDSQLSYWAQTPTPVESSKMHGDVTKLFMGIAILSGLLIGREFRKSAPSKRRPSPVSA